MAKKRRQPKKTARIFLVGILILILGVVFWQMLPRLEGGEPTVAFEGFNAHMGVSSDFSLVVTDKESGLRKVWVALLADGREQVLKTYECGETKGGAVFKKRFEITVEPAKLHIAEGSAVLRIAAWDDSWRGWGKGNRQYIEKQVTIDTTQPEVEMISRQHYISRGGACVAVYRLTEPEITHGVQVGDDFFPGHAGALGDPHICLAFFAVSHDQKKNVPIFVKAVDRAGNTTQVGSYFSIKSKVFKEDEIRISDAFLQRKMPEFTGVLPEASSLIDKFIHINSDLREKNNDRIRALCRHSESAMHWQDAFKRFPNSSREASFADRRTYTYQGETIGRAVHMGVDLASISNSPVPAANAGKVSFCGRLGIYGKTVIIDHGCGLFSLYAHLSHMAVKEKQRVKTGDILGKSGMSGLAGGDHLHFAMLIHDTFVNPVEWWDASWIKNNITGKIDTARQMKKDGAWNDGGFE